MGLRKDKRTGRYIADCQFSGRPRLRLSPGTPTKEHARRLHKVLEDVRVWRRRDLCNVLKAGQLRVHDLATYLETSGVSAQAITLAELGVGGPALPTLGDLVPRWYTWLEDPATILGRTQRRPAPNTIRRYRLSMGVLMRRLPNGAATTLEDLTYATFAELRRKRVREGAERGFHRDLVAMGAFLTWCADVEGLRLERVNLSRHRTKEPVQTFEVLKPGDLERLLKLSPPAYRPLWVLLALCGLRIDEAQSLRVDQLNRQGHGGFGHVILHEGYKRLKSVNSTRTVPVLAPELFWPIIEPLCKGRIAGTLLFTGQLADYAHVARQWKRLAKELGYVRLEEVQTRTGQVKLGRRGKPRVRRVPTLTLHDLRHTYGVMLLRAGFDIEVIRQYMGHGSLREVGRYVRYEAGQEQVVARSQNFQRVLGLVGDASPEPDGSDRPRLPEAIDGSEGSE